MKSINVFNVLEGEKYWKDPEKFDPDRFLDEFGHLQVPEAFIPFSIGKNNRYLLIPLLNKLPIIIIIPSDG